MLRFCAIVCGIIATLLPPSGWGIGRAEEEPRGQQDDLDVPLYIIEVSRDDLDDLDKLHDNTGSIISDGFKEIESSSVLSFRGVGFYWMPQRVMCNLFPVRQDGTLDTETKEQGYGRLENCRSAAAWLKDEVRPKDGTEILSLYSNLRKQIDKLQEEAHGLKQTVEGLEVRLAEAREEVTVAHSATDAAEEERKTARADAARAQAKIDRMLAATRHPSAVLIDPGRSM